MRRFSGHKKSHTGQVALLVPVQMGQVALLALLFISYVALRALISRCTAQSALLAQGLPW